MTFYFLRVNKIMESKDIKEKITCGCGAVVIKSNLKAHLLTKKHLASTGQLANVVKPVKTTNSKKKAPKEPKVPKVKWQQPDDEEEEESDADLDELDGPELEDDEEGAFEDEVMDVLELLTQKVDNLINQNVISKVKDVLERFNNLELSFKQSHNELVGLVKELNLKTTQLRSAGGEPVSTPPLPQRANEKCQ